MGRLRQKMLESVKACIMGVSAFAHRHIALTLVFAMCCGIISVPVIRDIRLPATILGIPSFFWAGDGRYVQLPDQGLLYYPTKEELKAVTSRKRPLDTLEPYPENMAWEEPSGNLDITPFVRSERTAVLVRVRILKSRDAELMPYENYRESRIMGWIQDYDPEQLQGSYRLQDRYTLMLAQVEDVILSEKETNLRKGAKILICFRDYGYLYGLDEDSVWYLPLIMNDTQLSSWQQGVLGVGTFRDQFEFEKTHSDGRIDAIEIYSYVQSWPVRNGYVYTCILMLGEEQAQKMWDPVLQSTRCYAYPEEMFAQQIAQVLNKMIHPGGE